MSRSYSSRLGDGHGAVHTSVGGWLEGVGGEQTGLSVDKDYRPPPTLYRETISLTYSGGTTSPYAPSRQPS